ncbi:MAG: hypothetical protein V1849_05155 [Chloroflexota bacterium]
MDWNRIPDQSTIEKTMTALREHGVPLEDARMKSVGYPGTFIGKMVVYVKEGQPKRITTILVKEKLGF